MLKDTFGREIRYLRLSITDRCNLRCRYCLPEPASFLPAGDLLTAEELLLVCEQAAYLGIDSFRLTGGEPLIRPDCASLIAALRRLPGVSRVALTTNGVLLGERLGELLTAGLDAVNIHLDTMDPAQYAAISGSDALDEVLDAIRQAAPRLPVKINCVVQRGVNEEAPLALATLARDWPVDVRLIELMPVGAAKTLDTVPNETVLARLEAAYGKGEPDDTVRGDGPAVYWCLPGFAGRIGLISAVHARFCDQCSRLRLTAAGELKPCLCYADTVPLRPILRDSAPGREERVREAILQAVRAKPRAHTFERREQVTENRSMAQIGG